ncbi:trypco2 family protein [Streptomyces lavendulae]|uniref:trypco2 family protein n=1 Tax=Streptomyces lavendulae TaxID=1914 RepID=UPI0034067D50
MAAIGLAAAIEELRQELYQAQDQGSGEQFSFQVEEAQLELTLELRHTGQADGKVEFGVVRGGVGGTRASGRTHKLTLKLKVKDRAAGGASPEWSLSPTSLRS